MRDRGYDAVGVPDHASALDLTRQESPELALIDLRLPGESGIAVLRDLDPATVVVVLIGYLSIATAVEAVKSGAANYLTKPADADQIVAAFGGAHQASEGDVPSLARVEWGTSSACSQTTGEISPRPHERLGSIAVRYSASRRSILWPADICSFHCPLSRRRPCTR